MNNNLMFSSKTPEWATPQELFDELNKEFNFTLDPCATKENAKCAKYYNKEIDGLSQSWRNERVFCNPPYGRETPKWVKKCSEIQNGIAVMLIPARTDTLYFHNYIYNKAEIRFIKGRIKFIGNSKGSGVAPFPSMIVIFKSLV
jgi:site-specific DNA-methyltransferase (adenine-specific)